MKKNSTRIAALLLVVLMTTMAFVGGTFSKYLTEASGSSTATVAKWQIEYAAGDATAAKVTNGTIAFNLFSTINDTGNSADETDVKNGKIAPGTSGSFKMTVNNKSEVNAYYTIALARTQASNANVPIEYSLSSDFASVVTDPSQLFIGGSTSEITMENGTTEHTVYWRWAFENSTVSGVTDSTDTALGELETAPTVEVTATLTVTQKD